MKINSRNTSIQFAHQGLAETCSLHFVQCLEAPPNTVQPSAQRDLRKRGENWAGKRSADRHPAVPFLWCCFLSPPLGSAPSAAQSHPHPYLSPCIFSVLCPEWNQRTFGIPWTLPRSGGCSWRPRIYGMPPFGRHALLFHSGLGTGNNGQLSPQRIG